MFQNLLRRPFCDNLSTMHPRTGSNIHHMVGNHDGFFVVFNDNHGVTQVAQANQRFQQAFVVPLMQADGRLIQYIHHAHQPGTDLAG